LGEFGVGEVAGSPHVPTGDGAPGSPFLCAALHVGGLGEVVGGDLFAGLDALEGEGEAFADAVVAGGEDVGAAEAEHEEHFDGPLADAADLGEVLDDGFVVHLADAGERGDGAVDGFGGEVAEGEGLVGGEAGGAELGCGDVEDLLGGGVDGHEGGHGLEAGDEAGVDGGGGFAMELLVDDGLGEGFEGGLVGGEAEGEGAGAGDEFGEFGVGGGEGGYGLGGVVGELAAGAAGVRHLTMIWVEVGCSNWTIPGPLLTYDRTMKSHFTKFEGELYAMLPDELVRELELEEGSLVDANVVMSATGVPAMEIRKLTANSGDK